MSKTLNQFKRFSEKTFSEKYLSHVGLLSLLHSQQKKMLAYSDIHKNFCYLKPNLNDLARLHWLASRKSVVNILEFGSGFSTTTFAHALSLNTAQGNANLAAFSRASEPMKIFSVDESSSYQSIVRKSTPTSILKNIKWSVSTVDIGLHEGRICTFYKKVPDVMPDIIYLDGPSQNATRKTIAGIGLTKPERMPIAADILRIEYLMEPGALIIVDGRTTNARFLADFLKRNWRIYRDESEDFTLLELQEDSLGRLNREKLTRSWSDGWLI